MKNYLEFEKEIKSLEEEVDALKSPFGSEGISEVDTTKIRNTQTEINEKLIDEPEVVNASPYEDGWFYKMKPQDLSSLEGLLSPEEYANSQES